MTKKTPPRSRARDSEATKRAILDSARIHFAQDSYDRTGLREIAADAQIDPALIIRMFGSKDHLFEQALIEAVYPEIVFEERANCGDRYMQAFGKSTTDELDHFVLLLRAANMPTMLPRLEEIISDHLMDPMMEWMGGEDARLRAKLVTIFICGLMIHNIAAGDSPLNDEDMPRFTKIGSKIIQGLIDGTDAGLMTELGLAVSEPAQADKPRPKRVKQASSAKTPTKKATRTARKKT